MYLYFLYSALQTRLSKNSVQDKNYREPANVSNHRAQLPFVTHRIARFCSGALGLLAVCHQLV